MKRNLTKTIEEGRRIIAAHEKADLSLYEFQQIKEMATSKARCDNDILLYAIANAFLAGVAVGTRNN